MKTKSEVEPVKLLGTPQSECFEGERKNRVLSECANLLSTSKTNESFDAGNPVGEIEPVNTSYCTMNLGIKKEQNYCSFSLIFICPIINIIYIFF